MFLQLQKCELGEPLFSQNSLLWYFVTAMPGELRRTYNVVKDQMSKPEAEQPLSSRQNPVFAWFV